MDARTRDACKARVRRFASHEWRIYRDLRLRALADSPDAFATTLAEAQQRPDEQWRARLASGAGSGSERALIAEVDAAAAGLVWVGIDASEPEAAHLYQMWVAPAFRRLGAGRMLLDVAIGWARSGGARYVALAVTCGDTPASRLYARAGFEPAGEPEPLRPGSRVRARPLRLDLGSRAAGRPRG